MAATFPGGIKSFTTKVDKVTTVVAEHVNSLQDEVVALETGLLTWSNWTPTFTGWSSITGTFKYARVGNIAFWVIKNLTGTSNSTVANISLPIATGSIRTHYGIFLGFTDGGVSSTKVGYWLMDKTGISFFTSPTAGWAASGTKTIPAASGFYEIGGAE